MTIEFEKAVLLEKALILNGMLKNGSTVEKKYAREEWEKLRPDFEKLLHFPTMIEGEKPFL